VIDLRQGDCLEVLKQLDADSIDSIVTDPPYGLSFMGRKWDYDVPSKEIWEQCLRVLKPGGHLLAFAGTRTQHRMCVNIEDAGFEIRDMIAWVYGSGFPKSMNVGKAIDKAAGAEREVTGIAGTTGGGRLCMNDAPGNGRAKDYLAGTYFNTAPATPEAQQWDGWGTALKPALEPITVARKPFKGTVANNVLEHGTGAINVDGCRVGDSNGRWPANLIHDGSDEVTELFPDVKTGAIKPYKHNNTSSIYGAGKGWKTSSGMITSHHDASSGSAARFFYCAKANKKDREDGNTHPTVKPTDLMAYLCRLVTPPSGVILDPFMGSGSTGKAAVREGFGFIGVEREAEYYAIAQQRVQVIEELQPKLDLAALDW